MKDNTTLPKNVGIWIRVSSEDQAKGESPEHHLARARAYAQVKGWNVKEVYDLAGVSGKSVMENPECKRMLADVRRGHITGIIFSKLARLARNTVELLRFSDIFRELGADMISLQETIDTSTPAGRLFFTMIAAMAQWEREEITDRINGSVRIRAKLGKPINANAPYGYQQKDRKIVINPTEAPIRKRVYELFLEHRRKGTVATLLNEAGYRTRANCKWSDMAVGRVLRCPSAKGTYYTNRHKTISKWTTQLKPESEWGTIPLEPIVSEDLWKQCNDILQEQENNKRKPGPKPVHLFAGIAFCSCGQKMYVRTNSPKYICEKCRNKIPITDLESFAYDELKAYFTAPEALSKHFANANQNLAEKDALLQTHKAEIQKIRDEMKRTHQLYLDGSITSQGFGQFYKPAEERLNQLLAELPKLEAELDHMKVNQISAEEVAAEAQKLYSSWPKLPQDRKRSIIQSIIEKVTISKDEIDITFSYLPTSEEMTKSQQFLHPR